MSIETVLQYIEDAGVSDTADVADVARQAAAGGYAFGAADLRKVLSTRQLLARLRADADLGERVCVAGLPQRALCAAAKDLGYALQEQELSDVLQALHARATRGQAGALDDRALDAVSGGAYFRPEIGDEVLVGFVRGDLRAPVVLGSLWNGSDTPPT